MKVIKKQFKCKECGKPIKVSKYSEYYKCPRHNKYYCNDCVQAGIRCKTCETYLGSIWGSADQQYKNLHIHVKAALMLMVVAIVAFVLIFLISLLFTPLTFLSGMITPPSRESMVSLLISYALPSTHFVEISRDAFLKGLRLDQMTQPALTLLSMGLGALVLALVTFKKKVL